MNNKKLILWMDALGFKDWILKEKSSEKGVRFLERAINSGFNLKPEYKKRYQTYVISDTLIIVSSYHELSDHCFLSMISSYLMKSFLTIGLPLRGAISYGECLIKASKNRLMVLGEGIVEAATNESLLDCFCIVQSLSCMKDFSEQVQKEGSKFQVEGKKYDVNMFFSSLAVKIKHRKEQIDVGVCKWVHPEILFQLGKTLNSHLERINPGDISLDTLKAFYRKFVNSKAMLDTIMFLKKEDKESAEMLWDKCLEIGPKVIDEWERKIGSNISETWLYVPKSYAPSATDTKERL